MSQPNSATSATPAQRSPLRAIGVGISVVLLVYIFYNAVVAMVNPSAFAKGFGLATTDTTGLTLVYAVRALFLGVYGGVLIARRDIRGLVLFLLVAVVMPLGDAVLLVSRGASAASIVQALVTAVVLALTAFLLWRGLQRRG